MKSYCFFLLLCLTACGTGSPPPRKAPTPPTKVYYPYNPEYTSAWEEGNPQHTLSVLKVWRALERGVLAPTRTSFADSLTLGFADGTVFRGRTDSVLALWQQKRNGWSYLESFPDSWMPVRAVDAEEDLVLIWGRQLRTDQQGRQTWEALHEIWKIDTAGRIWSMQQYRSPVL